MKSVLGFLMLFMASCASVETQTVDAKKVVKPTQLCGTESFLNQFAIYQCQSLQLEDNKTPMVESDPKHNVSSGTPAMGQPLLIINEEIVHAQPRARDLEIVCQRRLQVVLNPGLGVDKDFQKGWLTFKPECFKFKKVGNKKGSTHVHRHQ